MGSSVPALGSSDLRALRPPSSVSSPKLFRIRATGSRFRFSPTRARAPRRDRLKIAQRALEPGIAVFRAKRFRVVFRLERFGAETFPDPSCATGSGFRPRAVRRRDFSGSELRDRESFFARSSAAPRPGGIRGFLARISPRARAVLRGRAPPRPARSYRPRPLAIAAHGPTSEAVSWRYGGPRVAGVFLPLRGGPRGETILCFLLV